MATRNARAGSENQSRKAPRATRQQQLIDATIDTLARRGYADTTVADVARTAGLSVGIINFHFDSKDGLFIATLRYLANDYRNAWQSALAEAADDPAAKLAAMVSSNFSSGICTPRKLAAWCAFWAEAQSRPVYLAHCGANDAEYKRQIVELCRQLIEQGGATVTDAQRAGRAIDAATDGLWLDLVTSAEPLEPDEALATIRTTLAAFFPAHYDNEGALRPRPEARPT